MAQYFVIEWNVEGNVTATQKYTYMRVGNKDVECDKSVIKSYMMLLKLDPCNSSGRSKKIHMSIPNWKID